MNHTVNLEKEGIVTVGGTNRCNHLDTCGVFDTKQKRLVESHPFSVSSIESGQGCISLRKLQLNDPAKDDGRPAQIQFRQPTTN